MNEVSTVSAVAQEALVRFVQLLQNENVPTTDSPAAGADRAMPKSDDEVKRPHVHRHYDMPKRARELLRDDIIDQVVLALFHMERKPAAFASLWKDQSLQSRDTTGTHEVSPLGTTGDGITLNCPHRTRLPNFLIFLMIPWHPHRSILLTSRMSSRESLWACLSQQCWLRPAACLQIMCKRSCFRQWLAARVTL